MYGLGTHLTYLLVLVLLVQHAACDLARLHVLHHSFGRAPYFKHARVSLALDVRAVGLAVAAAPLGHLHTNRN